MMKKRSRFLFLLSFVSLVILSGCVNLIQEITVNEDGSGRLRFAYGVESEVYPQFQSSIPDGFRLEDLLSNLIQDENITEVTIEDYENNGRTWQSVELKISDVVAVFSEGRRIGPLVMVIDLDEEIYYYAQTIDLSLTNVTIPGINLLDFRGTSYTVRLESPHIINTNGVQRTGGSSTWEVPLRELVQEQNPVFINAELILEPYEGVYIPWDLYFPYIVFGFLGLGLAIIMIVIIVNTTGKEEERDRIQF